MSNLDEDTVILGDLVGDVGEERVCARSRKTSLLLINVDPAKVRERRVNTAAEELAANLLELGVGIVEGYDLGTATRHRVTKDSASKIICSEKQYPLHKK
jgi:hypothetical protein